MKWLNTMGWVCASVNYAENQESVTLSHAVRQFAAVVVWAAWRLNNGLAVI